MASAAAAAPISQPTQPAHNGNHNKSRGEDVWMGLIHRKIYIYLHFLFAFPLRFSLSLNLDLDIRRAQSGACTATVIIIIVIIVRGKLI